MFVKDRMTSDLISISEDAPISQAALLMDEKKLKRLPVINSYGKLVGILTTTDIRSVSPSKATSLSIFEINYILEQTKVSDAMTKKPLTISPYGLLEEAAVKMRVFRVGALIVIDNDMPVGIITESDIFDAFIELLGFDEKGVRFSIEANNIPGVAADISEALFKHGANISHIANFISKDGKAELIIRAQSTKAEEIIEELGLRGYKATYSYN